MKKNFLSRWICVLNEGTNGKVQATIEFITQVVLVLLFVVEMSTMFYIFH